MIIDEKLLSKLERLSMLEIADKETTKKHLNETLDFVNNLQELTLDNEEQGNISHTPLREDEPHLSHITYDVLSSAPQAQGDFFIVPKIIE